MMFPMVIANCCIALFFQLSETGTLRPSNGFQWQPSGGLAGSFFVLPL